MSDFSIFRPMNIKSLFLIVVFCTMTVFVKAQEISTNYQPKNLDSLKIYLERINRNYVSKIDGAYSAKIKKIFKDRDEKVLDLVEDSVYVFSSNLKNEIAPIIQHIYSSNPSIINKDFSFFLKNSIIPNAACYGDGMFEINLGLLSQLDSSDELAFIICHEIAHKILNHVLNRVTKGVTTINSEETKDKIKRIKKEKYGRTRAALSLIDDINIDMLDYSKEVEAQADSLGFVLFSNTKYLKVHALTSLQKLETKDEMIFHHNVKIDSVFNFQEYPFKKYWLKEEISLFDTQEKINDFSLVSDTLKTHPEIEFRVEKLINDFNLNKNTQDVKNGDNVYKNLKTLANKQCVQSTFDLNFLDLALYQLIEKNENNEISIDYYYAKMSELLKLIYLAKKKHELGKYVPQKNSLSDEEQLNKIRLFLHNLELNEVARIGKAFCDLIEKQKIESLEIEKTKEFFNSINN